MWDVLSCRHGEGDDKNRVHYGLFLKRKFKVLLEVIQGTPFLLDIKLKSKSSI